MSSVAAGMSRALRRVASFAQIERWTHLPSGEDECSQLQIYGKHIMSVLDLYMRSGNKRDGTRKKRDAEEEKRGGELTFESLAAPREQRLRERVGVQVTRERRFVRRGYRSRPGEGKMHGRVGAELALGRCQTSKASRPVGAHNPNKQMRK